jgi:hypothetical protein
MPIAFRDRIPALLLVALLHIAAVIAFLHAVIVEREPEKTNEEEHETLITLAPAPPPRPSLRKRRLPAAGGSNAVTAPYFNPYTYKLPPAAGGVGSGNGIALALSACDPGRYDIASREVRAVCDRIGMALRNDPGRFGFTSDVSDPQHWHRELARREAPYLAPCMSPGGFDVLHTLSCLYENVFIGYKPEHRRRYSE